MKHKAFTLIEAIVCVAIIVILVAILFPVFAVRGHNSSGRPGCTSNLKQIALATKQYIQDYDECYPPLAVASSGYWAGSLQPYVKSWQVFQCPTDGTAAPTTTDYFYNARLAAVEESKVVEASVTLLFGEGSGDQLTLYHLSQLPAAWREDERSPATRHLDGANYAFADGHVKWLKPEQITLAPPSRNQPTFLVK